MSKLIVRQTSKGQNICHFRCERTSKTEEELDMVIIPDNVSIIREKGFKYCNLKKIIMSDSIINIRRCAFIGCSLLTDITLSKRIRYIRQDTFSYCYALKNIIIPKNVKHICKYAFSLCKSLYEITIENENIKINPYAFNGCINLTVLNMPTKAMVKYFDMFMDHSYRYNNTELRARLMNFKQEHRDEFPKELLLSEELDKWLEYNE